MKKAGSERGDTATQILDVAERLVQVRGFNGFSYADVAAELKVTKAALHYHFAGKAELGEALVTRYAARFADALGTVEAQTADAPARLQAYAGLYLEVLRQRRMCLCGMMAAEYETLPAPMKRAIVRFFDENETWLTGVLAQGRKDGTLQFTGHPARRPGRSSVVWKAPCSWPGLSATSHDSRPPRASCSPACVDLPPHEPVLGA